MKGKPNICTAEKAMNAILDLGFKIKNIYTLWISPSEEAVLNKMGYNPKKMVCIERFDDESVFAQISVSEPVLVGLKDGGGKSLKNMTISIGRLVPPVTNTDLEEIERQRQEIKLQQQEIEQQQKEILARIEAIEAKRKAR